MESLRALIRIPSINPPDPQGGAAELEAARWIAASLADARLRPEVFEPVPGRGSVVVRLRGDGTGGQPLLLLSHLDVVPAPPERWTHDPFAADVADGYVYGRGAVDMKDLVAMELEVVRLLAAEARAAGRDPASDPIPGLRRDVLFACTADEEAGGLAGVAWLVEHRPDTVRAAGAINESGAVSVEVGGRRLYPIQVAEKGYAVYRITIHGTGGHGSIPRAENAEILAAEAIRRLAEPGEPRVTAPMRAFLDGAADAIGGSDARAARILRALAGGDERLLDGAAANGCSPYLVRVIRALVRDTISPNVVHAGVKYNVIPGEAVIEIDCRRLPGTSEAEMRRRVVDRLGPELASRVTIELFLTGEGIEAPADSELFGDLADSVAAADPEGVPLPVMAPFGTDAKHLVALGVPTYGFSPLRHEFAEGYLERWHGVDERVSIEGLRWGLPVLYDAVRRFCG
ncbi:MAG TPA: M20/M25/M40 family metallo-hydrolase [Candidatus Limnocylindrales bacterium]|nr:M20/M25/M40 family metallo-hydrolase [Candidatus Limnocylindrales bacterium]